MEDIILQKDIRRFFLGKHLYERCQAGGRMTEKDLVSRLGQLHLRDNIFKHIELDDLVRLCGLKSKEEDMMDTENDDFQDSFPTTSEFRIPFELPRPFQLPIPLRDDQLQLLGPPRPLQRQDEAGPMFVPLLHDEDFRHPGDVEWEQFGIGIDPAQLQNIEND